MFGVELSVASQANARIPVVTILPLLGIIHFEADIAITILAGFFSSLLANLLCRTLKPKLKEKQRYMVSSVIFSSYVLFAVLDFFTQQYSGLLLYTTIATLSSYFFFAYYFESASLGH